jgi:hypothetical protein
MAALTLHCETTIRNRPPETSKVNFTITVDYDRSYAYVAGAEGFFGENGIEFTGIQVTPAQINFRPKSYGLTIMEQASVSRTNGEVVFMLKDALEGDYRIVDGTCTPGEFVSPPRPAF